MTNSSVSHADKSHLVYEFTCPERECQSLNQSYIGLTSCTIRERFINHRNKGSIFAHYFKKHGGQKPDVDRMVAATKVLYHCDNRNHRHINIVSIDPASHVKNGRSTITNDYDRY